MVTPPLIDRPTVRVTAAPGHPSSGNRSTASITAKPPQPYVAVAGSGYEFHRQRIGDHVGGDGFFRSVKGAVASWIASNGSAVNTAWLRGDLESAIPDAKRDPLKHPDSYIEFRVADLDSLIAAIVELQRTKEKGRQQFAECEPTYPAPLGSVEEARALLAQVFDEHVASIAMHSEAVAAYEADLKAWQSRQPGGGIGHDRRQ